MDTKSKKNKNSFAKSIDYIIRQARSGSKVHIAMIVGAVAVVALALILIVNLAVKSMGDGSGQNSASVDLTADKNYNKEEEALDVDQLGNTVLAVTSDAGQDYLDNTLFIGDSNTVRTMLYGHTTWDNVVAAVSMGVQHITSLRMTYFVGYKDAVTVPEAVKIIQPQRIIITYGTNNTIGWDTETFIAKYKAALKAIKEAYPYADIIINSIPPIDRERENLAVTMQVIDKFNKELSEMAKEEGYKFLNSSEVLKDETSGFAKKDYTIGDGVHLSKTGMDALMKYIRTHAYITEDTRPKPLSKIPKREETPTGIISQDPLAVRGTRVKLTFVSSDTQLGTVDGEVEQKIKRTITSSTVTAIPNTENGGIFVGWTANHEGLSSASDASVKYTVPNVGEDVTEIVITANFKKAEVFIKHNSDVKSSISLDKGSVMNLTANVTPGFTGSGEITWQSDDKSIATVDSSGKLTAVSGGSTKIYASILGRKIYGVCQVTVKQALESISVSGEGTMKTNSTTQMTLTLNPSGASADKTMAVWSSSNESVATVSQSGLVSSHAEGSATITCTLAGKSAQHKITVTAPKPLTGITITGHDTVYEGQSIQLGVGYTPSDTTDSKTALWSSDNPSVASVVDGTVTGISAGNAKITCKVGNHTAEKIITVAQEPNSVASVEISSTSLSIEMGGTAQLTANAVLAYPQRPEGVDVTQHWSSANGYITVNNGHLTVRGDLTSESGTLSEIITVTIGGKSAQCAVTITGVTIPQPEAENTPPPEGDGQIPQ